MLLDLRSMVEAASAQPTLGFKGVGGQQIIVVAKQGQKAKLPEESEVASMPSPRNAAMLAAILSEAEELLS